MLAQRLLPIPAAFLTGPDGAQIPIHFTCHGAATYWLYCEAYDQTPMPDFFRSDMFFDCSAMMTKLAKFGRILDPPGAGALNATPGTVLIFVHANGSAEHTCILNSNRQIAGYNQIGWFNPDTGIRHQFSVHSEQSIKWRGRNERLKVTLPNGTAGNLMAVDENTATAFYRHNYVQKFF